MIIKERVIGMLKSVWIELLLTIAGETFFLMQVWYIKLVLVQITVL